MLSVEQLVVQMNDLSVSELVTLKKRLESEWDVSTTVLMPTAPQSISEPVEIQTEFDVVMTSFGIAKINVIKAVREIRPVDLKEAKALVESCPVTILEHVSKEYAEQASDKLRAQGAQIEIH